MQGSKRWLLQLNTGLDRAMYAIGVYGLPALLAVVSAIALLFWTHQYGDTPGARSLAFRVAQAPDAQVSLTPAQALALLSDPTAPAPVALHDTQLSERPFWLLVALNEQQVEPTTSSIEFASRHATDLSCWNAETLASLGTAGRANSAGALTQFKAGFALRLASAGNPPALLCKAQFVGPARITVLDWPTTALASSGFEFHRNAGLLDGGLIVLALFVLTTALVNRRGLYVLFAVWLLVNLRMAALSAGWDTQWLGRTVPTEWVLRMRIMTIAVCYAVTATLFRELFREDLAKIGYAFMLRAIMWPALPLLVITATLPYATALPFTWAATGMAICIAVFLLGQILYRTRSRVAMWYSASLVVTLGATLYEVVAAAIGVKGMIGAVNSVTAALSSSLLASLAIAEQMRQEHNQRLEAQAELEHTYEAIPIGLFTLDLQGRFTSANPALLEMLGPDVLSPGRHAWLQYFHDGAWTQLYHLVQAQGHGELELRGRKVLGANGYKRYLVKAALARDKIEGSLQDVTEKSRATEELQFMANNDSLTKVLNRRGIERTLERTLADLGEQRPLALAYLDLDRFKLINDLFGHNAGDEVLQQVCTRVSTLLSGGMVMGRMGGDEFLIVMPDTRTPLATVICQGIVSTIGGTPYRVGDKAFHVRGSIGLIEVSPGTRLKDAVSTADRACREAKARHQDGLVVYEKNAVAFREHEAELRLVERLSSNAATDGLFLEMQPIMSLNAPHASLNFEVLLRMRGPDGKLVPTDRVIAAGENSGRMGVIDRWVLSATLSWLNTHLERLKNTRFICLNLSGASLNDEKFMHDVYAMLARNIHVAGHLCFEITESVALHDLNNTRRFIDKVRSYGAKVALDDFGAGYTSFSYLKELPADLLKIDGSFIVNMNKHPANVAIVEAIVNLGRNLGMRTVAEWAEDLATVRTLVEIGVDYVQGFAVARPQSPERLLAASSSASFIEDAELLSYTYLLDKTDDDVLQVDMFDHSRFRNLH
ncbi:bifunctional diguanylate cyclase/phosphodiesterase [Pseudorhodoferax sp. Leaf267]|uniref:putative bifunctional diguanylate cyclase/phosphodiesterase n=1 Tax=Pseudorhodoferax sp. Leaf267 TaxID=1736316 RepID=UPI0006F2F9E7|nr:EAL domain-containing protein [Pseudorhodoferax sp. Leaf267]KQP14892.1 diguanylate cyclase [Pseudorhodoferax sp. Leaf267]